MRYGKENAGVGPGLGGSPSMPGLGDGADIDSGIEVAVISGGGSMKVEELWGTMGSGSKGISSEPDEVSIVI